MTKDKWWALCFDALEKNISCGSCPYKDECDPNESDDVERCGSFLMRKFVEENENDIRRI